MYKRFKFLKAVLLLLIIFFSFTGNAQSICWCYKGEWGHWNNIGAWSSLGGNPIKTTKFDDGSGFTLYSHGGIRFLSFRITDYNTPSKKEIKEHLKNNEWFTYNGTVEYYVNREYPTAQSLSKANTIVVPRPRTDTDTPQLIRVNAVIKVAPYKKHPEVFNIWFDNVGLALSVRGLKFK